MMGASVEGVVRIPSLVTVVVTIREPATTVTVRIPYTVYTTRTITVYATEKVVTRLVRVDLYGVETTTVKTRSR